MQRDTSERKLENLAIAKKELIIEALLSIKVEKKNF